jgi:hypothetical protein
VIAVAARPGGNSGSSGKGHSQTPAVVQPVPQTGNPSDDARNLADWLRSNSG